MLIAEIGSVHDGSFGNAVRLIETAAACGADAVKFQTHIAVAETRRDAPMPPYFAGEPRFEYFERTGFTEDQWKELKATCETNGVVFLSSPFSLEAVKLLERIGIETYKVPSGEVTNTPMLERIVATNKPVLLSSGMSDWMGLDAAVAILKKGGPLTVMQCSSIYPCPPEQVGLNVISEIKNRYALPVGFSDHTLGPAAALAACALGVEVIEKHFTLSRQMYGSDANNSMEPDEFRALAQGLREIRAMLAHPVNKNDTAPYLEMKRIFEKSIVAALPIAAGVTLTRDDLAFKKPGDGIPAARYESIIGKTAKADLPSDHMFAEDDFE